jgi:hypothetical protein
MTYITGGITGALFYIASYRLFPVFEGQNALLLGASASVFAVLVAIAFYDPNREIHLFLFGRFKLKYLALFYVILSLISISMSNPGGNISHLGGAFWGWFYILNLRRGRDLGYGIYKVAEKIGSFLKMRKKLRVTYKQPPRDDHDYNRMRKSEQDEINRILEKIKASGYDSLSKVEKETLFRQSN